MATLGVGFWGICTPTRSFTPIFAGLRRMVTLVHRLVLFRSTQPGLQSSAPSRLLSAFILHMISLSIEIMLILFLVASLWCLEPSDSVVEAGRGGEILVIGQCSFSALLIFLSAPPAASLLPPFLSIFAISLQSPKLLRTACQWRTVSLIPNLLSLALAPNYFQQLGTSVLLIPVGLVFLILLQIQLSLVEIAELEAVRPVRGWRGLIEVRGMEGGGGEGGLSGGVFQ